MSVLRGKRLRACSFSEGWHFCSFLLFMGIVFPEYMVVNGIYRKDVGVCYSAHPAFRPSHCHSQG